MGEGWGEGKNQGEGYKNQSNYEYMKELNTFGQERPNTMPNINNAAITANGLLSIRYIFASKGKFVYEKILLAFMLT